MINKMLLYSYDDDIKWNLSERANQNKFLEDFWNTSYQNLKNIAHFFQVSSISIHAIRSDKRQETVSNSLKYQN